MSTVNQIEAQQISARESALSWQMVYAISAAFLIGTFIITAVGFASPEVLHNAAHDIRHGLAFPCH